MQVGRDEADILRLEVKENLAGGAITVLGHDQARLARKPWLCISSSGDSGAKQDNVGVLLDGPGFADVTETGLTVGPLHFAVELAEGEDGDFQFAGQALDAAEISAT